MGTILSRLGITGAIAVGTLEASKATRVPGLRPMKIWLTDRSNHHAFGTFVTSPAEQALLPKAGGGGSLRTSRLSKMILLFFHISFRRTAHVVLFSLVLASILTAPVACAEIPKIVQYGKFIEPPVTLIEAAQLADEHLQGMNLPSDCFIRGIIFSPTLEEEGKPRYVVYFRPEGGLISVDRSKEPISAEFEFMNVWMDKKVTIERRIGTVVKPSDTK